ncbi:hypothetical protein [Paraburkholderia elongata]|uniref:DUF305 domain-containing protein n=1 Tax=Paraburkholderia elongata TaxID=2675747 RepID=A0A972NUV5_9BURK|nr:hypothetical protein [Paraburkholderia elongata]NPT58055.1 hypothetical protein [Paraburkholderia elongata]
MNAKLLLTASLLALSLGTSAVAMAAGGTGNDPSHPPQMREHGSTMMGGMGMGGMGGGTMGSCPMMGGDMGMNPKTAMRMHGEMMKAMGDIMLKYSDQAGASPSK